MNVLIVCAGGLSTGVLVRKMKKFWKEQNEDLTIKAIGLNEFLDNLEGVEAILVGPQVAYRLEDLKAQTDLPIEVIDGNDFALGNTAHIMEQLKGMIAGR